MYAHQHLFEHYASGLSNADGKGREMNIQLYLQKVYMIYQI